MESTRNYLINFYNNHIKTENKSSEENKAIDKDSQDSRTSGIANRIIDKISNTFSALRSSVATSRAWNSIRQIELPTISISNFFKNLWVNKQNPTDQDASTTRDFAITIRESETVLKPREKISVETETLEKVSITEEKDSVTDKVIHSDDLGGASGELADAKVESDRNSLTGSPTDIRGLEEHLSTTAISDTEKGPFQELVPDKEGAVNPENSETFKSRKTAFETLFKQARSNPRASESHKVRPPPPPPPPRNLENKPLETKSKINKAKDDLDPSTVRRPPFPAGLSAAIKSRGNQQQSSENIKESGTNKTDPNWKPLPPKTPPPKGIKPFKPLPPKGPSPRELEAQRANSTSGAAKPKMPLDLKNEILTKKKTLKSSAPPQTNQAASKAQKFADLLKTGATKLKKVEPKIIKVENPKDTALAKITGRRIHIEKEDEIEQEDDDNNDEFGPIENTKPASNTAAFPKKEENKIRPPAPKVTAPKNTGVANLNPSSKPRTEDLMAEIKKKAEERKKRVRVEDKELEKKTSSDKLGAFGSKAAIDILNAAREKHANDIKEEEDPDSGW